MTGSQPATHAPFLVGDGIYLREVQLSDVNDRYHSWLNDAEVGSFLESRFYPTSIEALRDYVAARRADPANVFLAIVKMGSDQHIGNIKLGPINWIHRFAEIGVLIGEKSEWGKGYATEAIRLVAEHAFGALNLHKLTAGCYEQNHGSINAFTKAGFVVEGIRKEHYYHHGAYVDAVLLGLVRPP